MRDEYLGIAVKLELENANLKRRYNNLRNYYTFWIIMFCIFFLLIGEIFLICQYYVGFEEGKKSNEVSLDSCTRLDYFQPFNSYLTTAGDEG
jgi:hypothetical protein